MKLVYDSGLAKLFQGNCLQWLAEQPELSVQAVVTDPPYGFFEFTEEHLQKLRSGKGGIWRIPPSIGGSKRSPLPRFTILDGNGLQTLFAFFEGWAKAMFPVLVPGAHLFIASSPLVSQIVSTALSSEGFEKRGEVVRLVRTLRGGDRPKGAETEFPEVSAMPRSCWEPWLLFRKPFEGTLAQNLTRWRTGGLRRTSLISPFCDVIESTRTPKKERELAPHPSLKPQAFLRQVVRAALPLGEGTVLDPFAGSGSTLAACEALSYQGVGVEVDEKYASVACRAIPALASLSVRLSQTFLLEVADEEYVGSR